MLGVSGSAGTRLLCINSQRWLFTSPSNCSQSTDFWLNEWISPYHRKYQDDDKSEGARFRAEFSVLFCLNHQQTLCFSVVEIGPVVPVTLIAQQPHFMAL